MLNTNVIYIDYLDSYLDVLNESFPKWFRKVIYKILNFLGYIKRVDNLFVLMCLENGNINQRMVERLIKKLKELDVRNIALPEILLNNSGFVALFENEFNILDGKWLYNFLILDIVRKIAYVQNKKISEYEITILCNNPTETVFENIKMLCKECKILNILTIDNIDKFIYIEKELYEKYGLILNVSTNVKKVCLFSNIIINIDFKKDILEKCTFNKNSILIQCTKEKVEKNLKAVITFYRLDFIKIYTKFFNQMKHFEEEILYESLLYHNISLENVRKLFERDNLRIRCFEGLHGKINFKELKNT